MKMKLKKIDIEECISRLTATGHRQFPLSLHQIEGLCHCTRQVLIGQPTLLELKPPVTVCGDIHGQFQDLQEIFRKSGDPSEFNYLFLGDYVDRGKKSLETICLLMCYKLKHPLTFFLLRGNHECSSLNKIYGFMDECRRKNLPQAFKLITNMFHFLPVAAVIGQRIFCVHGGISPLLGRLEDLNQLKRPFENKDHTVVHDMLWADPNTRNPRWGFNLERGVSYVYGPQAVEEFLAKHDFDLICRSHQVVEQGYQFHCGRQLLTVFSAPNYCQQFDNFGAMLHVASDLTCSIEQLTGKLQKHQPIIRNSTPIKQKKEEEPENISPRQVKTKKMPRSRTMLRPNNIAPWKKREQEWMDDEVMRKTWH